MLSLYVPQTPEGWLALASALVTFAFGLTCLCAPRVAMRLLRLNAARNVPQAVAGIRTTMAGFHLGVPLAAVVLDQYFVWLAFGTGWAFSAVGRLVSLVIDRGARRFNAIALVIEIALAAGPLMAGLRLLF